jgi:transposase
MHIAVLGIDLGKNSCSLAGLDETGRVVLRRRMRRDSILLFASKLPPCVVAMEACCGAHHLGRLLEARGHAVRLMSPEYVRPYVKAHKNDDRDAEAIAEAATRPTMRFVALKSPEQLDTQTLHRARDRLVGERTALMNQLRAILLERGIVVPQGVFQLSQRVRAVLDEDCATLSPRVRSLIADMLDQWRALDERIRGFDQEFAVQARADEAARRLATIPGIGPLNATALVAAVGDARTFARGRDLAAWLGLVPRQATTGGKPRLLGITKRGSTYLRKLLLQGARSVMPKLARSDTWLGAWLRGLLARAPECGCGGARQQAGADRLGGAAAWPRLRVAPSRARVMRSAARRCGAERQRGLQEVDARWPDSRPVFGKSMAPNGAVTPAPL